MITEKGGTKCPIERKATELVKGSSVTFFARFSLLLILGGSAFLRAAPVGSGVQKKISGHIVESA